MDEQTARRFKDMFAQAAAGKMPEIAALLKDAGFATGPGWTVESIGKVAQFFGVSHRQADNWVESGMPRDVLANR